VGEKTNVALKDFLAGSVKGVFIGDSVNPGPETRSASKLIGSEPALEICRVWEFFWPTTTSLKSTLAGTIEILAAAGDSLPAEAEAHPAEK
jgi:hypothetical protein